jgi:hypothetical protein
MLVLQASSFSHVACRASGSPSTLRWRKDQEARKPESLYVEAVK